MVEFFDNIKFVLSANNVNVRPLFRCRLCGEFKPKYDISNYQIPVNVSGVAEYHKITFICNDCDHSEQSNNTICDNCKDCIHSQVLMYKDAINSGPFELNRLIYKARCNITGGLHDLDDRCSKFEGVAKKDNADD